MEVQDVQVKVIETGKSKKKRGVIQSRGLGDILIALPIAREYYLRGEEIVWPVAEEFLGSLRESVPWVSWHGLKVDERGAYFVEGPLRIFKYNDVDEKEALYLYHYLNSQPQMTDPELFNILKFDQYKYQVAGVSFLKKWTLSECIVRNPSREAAFKASLFAKLGIVEGDRYAVAHLEGSSFSARINLNWIDPAVKVIQINAETMSDNIFDWLSVIEGAEKVICIDSVFANLIDNMMLKNLDGSEKDLYWIRRSGWDLTPILGLTWTVVSTDLPIKEPVRVDPAAEAKSLLAKVEAAKQQQAAAQQPAQKDPAVTSSGKQAAGTNGTIMSHVPFQAKGAIPKSFLDKVKPLTEEQAAMLNGGGRSRMPAPDKYQPPGQSPANAAQDLYKSLGVKF